MLSLYLCRSCGTDAETAKRSIDALTYLVHVCCIIGTGVVRMTIRIAVRSTGLLLLSSLGLLLLLLWLLWLLWLLLTRHRLRRCSGSSASLLRSGQARVGGGMATLAARLSFARRRITRLRLRTRILRSRVDGRLAIPAPRSLLAASRILLALSTLLSTVLRVIVVLIRTSLSVVIRGIIRRIVGRGG